MRSLITGAFIAMLGLAGGVRSVLAQTASPRAALETYLTGLKTGNLSLVLSVYYFGDRRPDFHLPPPIPIESHRVLKELVLDSVAAKEWNDRGIVPAAMPGDVQLEVQERLSGHVEMFSYSLRRVDGKWLIYAHSSWGAPD